MPGGDSARNPCVSHTLTAAQPARVRRYGERAQCPGRRLRGRGGQESYDFTVILDGVISVVRCDPGVLTARHGGGRIVGEHS